MIATWSAEPVTLRSTGGSFSLSMAQSPGSGLGTMETNLCCEARQWRSLAQESAGSFLAAKRAAGVTNGVFYS